MNSDEISPVDFGIILSRKILICQLNEIGGICFKFAGKIRLAILHNPPDYLCNWLFYQEFRMNLSLLPTNLESCRNLRN
jgi:hypothetical protein